MDVLKVILLVVALCAASATCESSNRTCGEEEIKCGGDNDKCIDASFVCDGTNDCGDNSEEEEAMCKIIQELPKGQLCGPRHVYCDGYCLPMPWHCHCKDTVKDPRICQMFKDGYIQRLDDVIVPTADLNESLALGKVMRNKLSTAVRHQECPPFFTLFHGHCYSFFFLVKMSWAESRALCQFIGGDLVTLQNETHHRNIASHLRHQDIKTDYWLGGYLKEYTKGWQWLDDTFVPLGTPFWTIRYNPKCWLKLDLGTNEMADDDDDDNNIIDESCYLQAPQRNPVGRCLAITHNKHYYFSDESCLDKKSPLCVLAKEGEKDHRKDEEFYRQSVGGPPSTPHY